MITKEQCRAARGLLDWTQADLAAKAGMSKTAINNFERGNDIRSESLQSIHNAFQQAGIEFAGDYGVHQQRDTVKILKGEQAPSQLLDDIFETVRHKGGEVLIANLDEHRFLQASPPMEAHLKRLQSLGVTERLLICEGDKYFLQPAHYYRWLPKEVYQIGMTTFIYADKVALQLWQEAMIIVIQSQAAARAERQRFEQLWAAAAHTSA